MGNDARLHHRNRSGHRHRDLNRTMKTDTISKDLEALAALRQTWLDDKEPKSPQEHNAMGALGACCDGLRGELNSRKATEKKP